MVAVSAVIVILAGALVIGQIAGVILCKSRFSQMLLMCLSLIGALAVLLLIIGVLWECASRGDWRAIEDTVGAWLGAAIAFSLIVDSLAIAICIKSAKG